VAKPRREIKSRSNLRRASASIVVEDVCTIASMIIFHDRAISVKILQRFFSISFGISTITGRG
jgi:hypothetical protein